jgi:hypothetical protein
MNIDWRAFALVAVAMTYGHLSGAGALPEWVTWVFPIALGWASQFRLLRPNDRYRE